MKKKKITIRESEIPYVEIEVFTNSFKPLGAYSLENFIKKYGG